MNGQQLHRRTIYHPRRKSRLGKPLWKSKRSSLKIHPSNPSIHPNRLTQFCRSYLFPMHPRSRRSASRSRPAANRPHLSSHQHQRTPHQWSSCPPSARSRSQTPRRGNGPSAASIFGQGKQRKSAHQRQRRKRLYQKLLQSAHEKQQRRTHSGKCSKRATTGLPEQPPQPRKSWPKLRQRRSRS